MANYYNQLIFVIIRNVFNFSKQLSIIKTCLIFKENLKILFRANLMTIIDGHQSVCFATSLPQCLQEKKEANWLMTIWNGHQVCTK